MRARNILFCLTVFALIAACAISYFALKSANKNQQIIRPFPNSDRVPVIEEFPDIMRELRDAKSTCEHRASEAKKEIRPVRVRVLARGEALYSETRTKFDGCIEFLSTGLTVGFKEADAAKIHAQLLSAAGSMSRFLDWRQNPRETGEGYAAASPGDWIAPGLSFVSDWIDRTGKANKAAIDRLQSDLEKCRFEEWKNL